MTRFAKYPDQWIVHLVKTAVERVIADAENQLSDIQSAWFSNSGWGFGFGQDCIRGEVALRPAGLEGLPITNVENACAGGSTSLHHGGLGVASGLYELLAGDWSGKGVSRRQRKNVQGFLVRL